MVVTSPNNDTAAGGDGIPLRNAHGMTNPHRKPAASSAPLVVGGFSAAVFALAFRAFLDTPAPLAPLEPRAGSPAGPGGAGGSTPSSDILRRGQLGPTADSTERAASALD
eukprot:COSAG05_NODE_355_length_10856_cov_7.197174_14_plen_110_part_00